MVCENEAKAVHHLHLKVRWLNQLRTQAGAQARIDVIYPEALAGGRLSSGVLIVKWYPSNGRGWVRWYFWWVEEMAMAR